MSAKHAEAIAAVCAVCGGALSVIGAWHLANRIPHHVADSLHGPALGLALAVLMFWLAAAFFVGCYATFLFVIALAKARGES